MQKWYVMKSPIRFIFKCVWKNKLNWTEVNWDQEKAFEWVEHQYLWQTLAAFGLNSGFIAMVWARYNDIVSVLKINSGLNAPIEI